MLRFDVCQERALSLPNTASEGGRLSWDVLLLAEIVMLLPNFQRQHRDLHIQKDVLPYALCKLLCPVSAALASIFRMDSIYTSYNGTVCASDLPGTDSRAF